MAKMTPSQWRQYASQWRRAGRALDTVHREELAQWKYDWRVVDALLEIGDRSPHKEEEPNGLVEMQRWFMKFARKRGLLPAVREEPVSYGGAGVPSASANCTGQRPASLAIPPGPKLALFCSVKCPGKLILDTYDLAQKLRDLGITVIGGFHSPMEQECLRILLRSPHSVVWCLARGMLRRIPSAPVDCRAAVTEGRLAIASPFPDSVHRVTSETAMTRNRFVADMATAIVVAHAAPGSKMEALCRELLAAGKPLYTFDHPSNATLIRTGAQTLTPATDWKRVLAKCGATLGPVTLRAARARRSRATDSCNTIGGRRPPGGAKCGEAGTACNGTICNDTDHGEAEHNGAKER